MKQCFYHTLSNLLIFGTFGRKPSLITTDLSDTGQHLLFLRCFFNQNGNVALAEEFLYLRSMAEEAFVHMSSHKCIYTQNHNSAVL